MISRSPGILLYHYGVEGMKKQTTIYIDQRIQRAIKDNGLNASRIITEFIEANYPIQSTKEELLAFKVALEKDISIVNKALSELSSKDGEILEYVDKVIGMINRFKENGDNPSIAFAMATYPNDHLKVSEKLLAEMILSKL